MLEEKWNIFVGPTGAYFIILHELDRFNLECSLQKGSAEGVCVWVCVCVSVCVFAPTYACMQAHAHTHARVWENRHCKAKASAASLLGVFQSWSRMHMQTPTVKPTLPTYWSIAFRRGHSKLLPSYREILQTNNNLGAMNCRLNDKEHCGCPRASSQLHLFHREVLGHKTEQQWREDSTASPTGVKRMEWYKGAKCF